MDLFYVVIDMQLQELNDYFNEVNTGLLLCVACLCPNDSFSTFDMSKLVHFAELYPKDFFTVEVMVLDTQLDTYIIDMYSSEHFMGLKVLVILNKK